jgi:hypothetical protein
MENYPLVGLEGGAGEEDEIFFLFLCQCIQ